MKPRDLFGIILRSLATSILVWGLWNTLAAIRYIYPTLLSLLNGTENDQSSVEYFIYGLPAVFGGIIVLRFAECFVNFTYREPIPPPLKKTVEVKVGDFNAKSPET